MWRGTSSHGIAAATSSGKCMATSIANLHLSMYHSRNVVKRQERPLAVVVSSSDARACPHGLHRASDLRVRTLAGQHGFCQLVEAETLMERTDSLSCPFLSIKQPTPC